LFAHVQTPYEVRRHADLAQAQHQMLADPVVQHALAVMTPFWALNAVASSLKY